MAGETTAGSIVGYLRLDTSDWNQAILAAQAQAEALGNTDPNVTVGVNSAAAIAELQAIHAAADHLNDSFDDLSSSSVSSGHQMTSTWKKVLMAVAPILPAMVPLGAAAIGVGAAMGAAGIAGIAAFQGIQHEMQAGTDAGLIFKRGISDVRSQMDTLAHIAAGGVLAPFQDAVQEISSHMPYLNKMILDVSGSLGRSLADATGGILSLFVKMTPAINLVMQGVENVAGAFESWAKSSSASNFVSYLVENLPAAGRLLSNLANIVGDLVQAFAPIGSTVLSLLASLTDLIDDIPVGVLQTAGSLIAGIGTAFLAWRGLRSLIAGVAGALAGLSTHLSGLSSVATSAASATSRMSLIMGGILGVIGLGVAAWSMWRAKQQEAERQQRALTDAIKEDNGVLGKNATAALQSSDAFQSAVDKLKQFHISAAELNAALHGNEAAITDMNHKYRKYGTVVHYANRRQRELGQGTRELSPAAKAAKGAVSDLANSINKSKNAAKHAALEEKRWADKTSQLSQHQKDLRNATTSAANATEKQSRAINKLNNEISQQISLQLQLQGSLTGYASARNQLIHTLRKNASTTRLNTKRGIENRQQIESTVGALQSYRKSQIDAGRSTRMATLEYRHNGRQLLQQIAKTDGASSATYKYTKKLLAIPDDVKTRIGMPGYDEANRKAKRQAAAVRDIPMVRRTHVFAGTGQAEAAVRRLKDHIATIHGKTVYIRVARVGGGRVKGGPGRNIHPGFYADGGIVGRAYASGGIESHVAQIATHGPRIWAEPETGGEAYIPMSPQKRPRSMQILKEVADRFDMTVVPPNIAARESTTVVGSVSLSDADVDRIAAAVAAGSYQGSYGGTALLRERERVGYNVASRGVSGSGVVPA